jgi:hypothetical protein
MTARGPWRRRCPLGHVDVVERRDDDRHGRTPTSRYYCRTCKKLDDPDPHHDHIVDAKTGEDVA